MSCGCSRSPLIVTRRRRSSSAVVDETGGCPECVLSHLDNARKIMTDAFKSRGARYKVVWHLAEAAHKAPRNNHELARALVEARRCFQRDGVIPDWQGLAELVLKQEV